MGYGGSGNCLKTTVPVDQLDLIKEEKIMAKKQIGVTDSYYSILTRGPLAGRPAYFIELEANAPEPLQISMKKLGKEINSKCSAPMVVLSGSGVFNNKVIAWCLDNNYIVILYINSSQIVPGKFNFKLIREGRVFPYIFIDSADMNEKLAERAFTFNYKITTKNTLHPDGLPVDMFRPKDMRLITISPNRPTAAERAVDICKHFGYYLDIPYKYYIGIR